MDIKGLQIKECFVEKKYQVQCFAIKEKNNVVMVRLDWTIQKPLQRLKKRSFNYRLEPILDPPVKPEDDERN